MSDTKRPLPEPWASLLARKGLSQSRLAAESGVSKSTVNRLVHGIGRPDAESVRRVADVLADGDTDEIWGMVGSGHADYGDFPIDSIEDELRLLTPKQRTALMGIVRSMSDPEGKRFGHVASPAEKSPPPTPIGSARSKSPAPSADVKKGAARKTTKKRPT